MRGFAILTCDLQIEKKKIIEIVFLSSLRNVPMTRGRSIHVRWNIRTSALHIDEIDR